MSRFRASKPLVGARDYDVGQTYDWAETLGKAAPVVPVTAFKTAPLNSVFQHIRLDLKVEVPCAEHFQAAKSIGGVYWVARIVRMAGYRVLLRYEGAPDDGAQDFWMSLGGADMHPVGWCASQGKPLVPPKSIANPATDWKHFLVKRLTGSRTMPPDWLAKVRRDISSDNHGFRLGMRLEILDREHSDRVRPGTIVKLIGPRFQVTYSLKDQPVPRKKASKGKKGDGDEDENEMADEFWASIHSPMIFPVGWAKRVGYGLYASDEYKALCEKVVAEDADGEGEVGKGPYGPNDAAPELFQPCPTAQLGQLAADEAADAAAEEDPALRVSAQLRESRRALCRWEEGMALEAMDLVEMKHIHVASVHRVLRHGWLEIRLDDEEPDFLPFHQRSPYLFPVGFCRTHGVPLTVPKSSGAAEAFDWEAYLRGSAGRAAPTALFDEDRYDSSAFPEGAALEATDMAEPRIVAPAIVHQRLSSRLLRLRFIGWGSEYDQYQDFRSPDLYPLGWAELLGHRLEHPPRHNSNSPPPNKATKLT